ncbi:MAG: hypothetical protein M4579_005013 [Chaenotheca gracillima]|nr:MAG: hypothetical protein M4579_005013 [Chaenotheca gracillima]
MAPRLRRDEADISESMSSMAFSDNNSSHSNSTAPTSYGHPSRPSLKQHETIGPIEYSHTEPRQLWHDDPRNSNETYASTVNSQEDLADHGPDYEVADYHHELAQPEAVPCTPPEFAELFPSTRRLCVRHDDSTLDGNMNLRVDTEVSVAGGRKCDFTLFHLRMHDLKSRDFSLRRYCRDSGREVCHSTRRYTKPSSARPGLQRSMSTALATIRGRHEGIEPKMGLRRQDSGYDSDSGQEDDEVDEDGSTTHRSRSNVPLPTNTTKLEFSNYAQVDVKRRGTKSAKRYEFHYWGTTYSWKRVSRKDGSFQEISYHLVNDRGAVMAHIVPVPLTTQQAREENARGGWVAPCSMWISDPSILGGLTDVADVIVATGLMALVDDSIKRRFHNKRSVQLLLPIPTKSPLKMEYVGPKRLIDEVFNRRSSSYGQDKQHDYQHHQHLPRRISNGA